MTLSNKKTCNENVTSFNKHYTNIFKACDGNTDTFFRKINSLFDAKSIVLIPERLYQLEVNNAYIDKEELTSVFNKLLGEYKPEITINEYAETLPDCTSYRIKITKKMPVLN